MNPQHHRMCKAIVQILLLATLSALQVAQAYNGAVVVAPNTFRIGVEETIFIQLSQLNQDTDVTISLHSPPPNNEQYATKTVRVKKDEPLFTTLTLSATGNQLLKDLKNYMSGVLPAPKVVTAVMKATARGKMYFKSPLVRVALNSGPVYIQLDKPIYQPGHEVKLRIIVTENFLKTTGEAFTLEFINPQNLIVYREEKSSIPSSGIFKLNYPLGPDPVRGLWTINVRTGHEFFTSTNETFEVKEYVLPTFDVQIEFTQKYILEETTLVEGKVISRYTYEEPVLGSVGLQVLLLPPENGNPEKVCNEIFGRLDKGEFRFKLDLKALRSNTPSPLLRAGFPNVIGSRLKLVAYVTEDGTNSREIVAHDKTLFVQSPYIISFERSLTDFKAGYTYSAKIDVRHPNGDPAVGTPIAISEVNMGIHGKQPLPPEQFTDFRGSAIFTFSTVYEAAELWVTAHTKDTKYSEQGNARNTLRVYPHQPMAGLGVGYVWLQPRDAIIDVRVGSVVAVEAVVHNPKNFPFSLYYLVVAHSRVISWGVPTVKDKKTFLWVLNVEVKPEMAPFFRIVVYAVQHQPGQKGYFLADSLRIQVENKCPYNGRNNELKLSLDKDSYAPKNPGILTVFGEVNSHVGVMAVDQALYVLRNESILTRTKFFTEWEKTDVGHGPGGGRTVGDILKNAGLVVLFPGDQVIDYPETTVGTGRRKRSASRCCDYSYKVWDKKSKKCTMTKKFYQQYCQVKGCFEEFDRCCKMEGRIPVRPVGVLCPRSKIRPNVFEVIEEEELYEEPTIHDIRVNFPETWLYEDFQIGDGRCPANEKEPSCDLTISAFPDSITSWNFHALAVSRNTGFCVAETIKTVVKRTLFVQVKLPYSAVRLEVLEVVATVFNYGGESQKVLLHITGVEGLCSEAKPGKRGKGHKLTVRSGGSVSHSFAIIPVKIGEFDVIVTARSVFNADVVIKKLKVVAEGIRKEVSSTQLLDPANMMQVRDKRADVQDFGKILVTYPNEKEATVSWDASPPEEAIPGTARATLTITGSVLVPTLDTSLQGVEGFFRNAAGCAEQCMIYIAPTIYSVIYLKYTGQLTIAAEDRARKHLAQGYAFSLQYRKPNGGISVWAQPQYQPTIWLTSYFMRVFCEMRPFVPAIQNSVIFSGLQWVASQQKPNGMFDGTVVGIHHVEMTGGLQGSDALTAFTLMSFVTCIDQTAPLPNVIQNARSYLESRVEDIKTQPYILAMVTYVLALTNSTLAAKANGYLRKMATEDAQGNRYWVYSDAEITARGGNKPWVYVNKPHALSVEITAYALLAQVALNEMTYAGPIVAWLTNQRNAKGAFVSTQDTVVTLEALAAYGKRAKELEQAKTNVDVFVNDALVNDKPMIFDKNSKNILKEMEIPLGSRVRVKAKGDVPVSVTLQIKFNSPGKQSGGVYNIETQVRDVMNPGHRHIKEVYTCIEYTLKKKSGMVLVIFGIPTGYRVEQAQLRELRDNKDLKIGNVEMRDSAVNLYFDQIAPSPRQVCFTIRLVRMDVVRDLQPTKIETFSYYEPDENGEHFYRINSENIDNNIDPRNGECKTDICICQRESCPQYADEAQYSVLDQQAINELFNEVCGTEYYSYVVQVLGVDNNVLQRRVTGKVVQVIRAAPEKNVQLQIRQFYLPSRCNMLKMNSYYLIIGKQFEIVQTIANVNSFRYIFDGASQVWEFPPSFLHGIAAKSPLQYVVQKLKSAECHT